MKTSSMLARVLLISLCATSESAQLPKPQLSRRHALTVSTAAAAATFGRPARADTTFVMPPPYPFEARDRKSNQGAIIREDYWYLIGKIPPRQLTGPLRGDDPQWNAFGSCTSSETGGNSCTYVSLKQRIPAYSKYGFSLADGGREYGKLGQLLQTKLAVNPTDEALWQEAAGYLVTESKSLPPAIIDAELKAVLFATAMTTSPNFPKPSRELLVARFYVNEAHYASQQMLAGIRKRDIIRTLQAWDFGKDAWNSYFQVVNRSVVPKVGDKFEDIV